MNGQNGHAQEQVATSADDAVENDDSDDDEKEEDAGAEGAATGGENSRIQPGALSETLYKLKLTQINVVGWQRLRKRRSANPRRRRKAAPPKSSQPRHESPYQSYSLMVNSRKERLLSIKTRTITAQPMKRNDILIG